MTPTLETIHPLQNPILVLSILLRAKFGYAKTTDNSSFSEACNSKAG
jgi:hypothetical protein